MLWIWGGSSEISGMWCCRIEIRFKIGSWNFVNVPSKGIIKQAEAGIQAEQGFLTLQWVRRTVG